MADKPTITVPEGQTGPVVTTVPGEPLDLTGVYASGVPDGPTGDSPPKAGSVQVFKDPSVDLPDPQGDTVRTSKDAALVDPGPDTSPTVGELRKAGYQVEGKDGDVPTAYTADSPTPPNEVHLVDLPEVEVEDKPEPKKAAGKQIRSSPENK